MVTTGQRFTWDETPWRWGEGYGRTAATPEFHVVAIDYGIKRNILRQLAGNGCKVTVVPATTSAADILALKPDGIFLSNGPGDPAATGEYAVPVIRDADRAGMPTFGICLGHQMLGLAVGAKTMKMHQGHHGANHPVKDLTTGKVEITSMNHGFAVDRATPAGRTRRRPMSRCSTAPIAASRSKDRPVFSVQYHPEASPGPRDSHDLFKRFVDADARRQADHEPSNDAAVRVRQFQPPCRVAHFGYRGLMDRDSKSTHADPTKARRARSPINSPTTAIFPTIPLPLVLYRGGIDLAGSPDPEEVIEKTFAANGWGDMWRNGIYPYVHYHSMIHEAMGIARGRAKVRFGGDNGAGDRRSRPATSSSCRPAPAINACRRAPSSWSSAPIRRAANTISAAAARPSIAKALVPFRKCRCRPPIRCSDRRAR